jgi:N-acetyl-gamma-glutamyl-phosphate reductase
MYAMKTVTVRTPARVLRAAVVGASGYSGLELLKILARRDDVEVGHLVAASSAGRRIEDVAPALRGVVGGELKGFDEVSWEGTDVAFVALPSGEGMAVVPRLLETVGTVIDLGGDFRLPSSADYEEFYRRPHTAPDLLGRAVYGLPEVNRRLIAGARFVANPGCYPTSIVLPLVPLLREGLILPHGISAVSMSGTSGAGRSSSAELSFSEIDGNIRAYKVGVHQHLPEIRNALAAACGTEVSVSFVPHLVPMTRGIHTTVHALLTPGAAAADVREALDRAYAAEPFVRLRTEPPQVRDVVHTNFCDISSTVDRHTRQLILLSTIDNLVKGAAGQAVQNMNITLGLPETAGLT